MDRLYKSRKLRLCLSLMLLVVTIVPGTLFPGPDPASAMSVEAELLDLLTVGPPALPLIPSYPLVPVTMPSRTGGLVSAPQQQADDVPRGPMGWLTPLFNPQSTTVAQAEGCTSTTVDLKVLVITADPTDTQTVLPAIRQVLDYQGTPYTVFTASPRPGDPAANRLASLLSSGCHGYYQGVILGNGQVAYNDPASGWQSALTDAEWQSLWSYERAFNIRQVTWYTYPSAEYGFNPPSSGSDTTSSPIAARYTGSGQSTFTYVNAANPLTIQNVWAYQATPLDSNTQPLFEDDSGNALGAVRTYPDGTQNLALTFDSNPNVVHNLVLAYGLVNWVTRGLFLGERHIFLTPQVDDIFIDSHVWAEGTPCGTNTEQNNVLYRMTGDDLQAVINWQQNLRAQPTTQGFWLDMVFNGEGTSGIFDPDTLTPMAIANESLFKWTNHTYTHANLDNTSYNTTLTEINQNNQVAQQLGLTAYSTWNLVTPDISGLENANALQAMFDAGIRYVVSDASRPGYGNPSPNAGIYNQSQPSILMIPRYPNNLFYNVTTPQQWVEEYNCIYRSFWGRDLTYTEILANESTVLLAYVLRGDMNPWMFHETNLRAYDGSHTLLGDLIDRLLVKYNDLFVLPVLSPTLDDLGRRVENRMAYNSAGVTASIVPGESITISTVQGVVVPVTGLNTAGAESYGGQPISYVSLSAGQSVTLPLRPNGAPTANGDSYTAAKNGTLIVPAPGVLGNDTDPDGGQLTAVLVSSPANGSLALNADGSFTYTPKANFTGNDSFTYQAQDMAGALSNAATVTIQVTNTPPTANPDTYSMHSLDLVLSVPAPGVLGNDTDANGDSLTAVLVTGPSRGVLIFNADGSFTYTPLPSLTSFTDSFTYWVFDGELYSNAVTVTIQVIVP